MPFMNLRRQEGRAVSTCILARRRSRRRGEEDAPRDGQEDVEPLVVVHGLDVERLDVLGALGHGLAADRRARERRAGRDDGRAAGAGEEARRARHADRRERRAEAGADEGREEARREADDEAAADGCGAHEEQALLLVLEASALEDLVVLLVLDGLLDLERLGEAALEAHDVHPVEAELLGHAPEEHARARVVH